MCSGLQRDSRDWLENITGMYQLPGALVHVKMPGLAGWTHLQRNVCGEQAYTYIVLSLCSAHIIDIRENDVHQTEPGVEACFLIQQVRTVCELPHLLFFFFCESYCWKYRERKRDIQCCLSSYLREVQSKSIFDKFSLKNKYKRRAPAGNDGCLCSAESFKKQKHVRRNYF